MVSTTQNAEVSTLAGGTLRVSTAAWETAPQSTAFGAPQLTRAYGGTTRHVETREGRAGGSVLSTLDYRGTAQTVELVPGNPATRTDVQSAIREGILRRGPGGSLEEVTR